ncbi:hypothetical protein PABG_11881 [Paracoccidioides brasiliensis Pb03]|uniref:Uncharacterized protein n=1 Tax=Paracoccidioides brasiliensis (strain Pb18) TaxID=502780 RepID=A0A0A0HTJ7_PARBD|nr:uncharacterized protein PADG_12317 [Paracoccidioides brasiliensis Pb18]KGM91633.1 hypothetical protein PADG_12317 [Paracoccidioides brasiliensis Pb18]KGY15294.1 hypothetical protein PABG_11881 [Paracoccidioides brasiliensis Pb03]ODH52774.1 hypothetical protein GX48_00968 [Paracoccidioides brasiliensis]
MHNGTDTRKTSTTTAHIVSSSRKSRNTLNTQESTTTGSENLALLSDQISINIDQQYPIRHNIFLTNQLIGVDRNLNTSQTTLQFRSGRTEKRES